MPRAGWSGRLRLLDKNASVYRDLVPRVVRAAPQAVILVITDPPDPLADLVRTFGFKHVLSSGTFLDSLRFRYHLAGRLGVAPASVNAEVLGEALTGAAVGAVTGAAQRVGDLPGAVQEDGSVQSAPAGGKRKGWLRQVDAMIVANLRAA